MPIYEYHCDRCKKTFESLVMGGKEPDQCGLCGAKGIHRVLSTCGFISKDAGGQTVSSSAGGSSCAGCSSTACSACSG
jgi:putative FmdB family regulatory protein